MLILSILKSIINTICINYVNDFLALTEEVKENIVGKILLFATEIIAFIILFDYIIGFEFLTSDMFWMKVFLQFCKLAKEHFRDE